MKKIILVLAILLTLSACESYGEKAESGFVEVFYENGKLKDKVTEIATYLDENKFSEDHTTSFKLTKDSLYNLKMVIKEGFEKDEKNTAVFMSIGYLLSMEIFNNDPINFELCDNTFKTLKTLPINHPEKQD